MSFTSQQTTSLVLMFWWSVCCKHYFSPRLLAKVQDSNDYTLKRLKSYKNAIFLNSQEKTTQKTLQNLEIMQYDINFNDLKQNNLSLESHSYWGCQIGFGLGRYYVVQPLNLIMVHQDLWWRNDLFKKERKFQGFLTLLIVSVCSLFSDKHISCLLGSV